VPSETVTSLAQRQLPPHLDTKYDRQKSRHEMACLLAFRPDQGTLDACGRSSSALIPTIAATPPACSSHAGEGDFGGI